MEGRTLEYITKECPRCGHGKAQVCVIEDKPHVEATYCTRCEYMHSRTDGRKFYVFPPDGEL